MNNFGNIFSDKQYELLSKEYNKILAPDFVPAINLLQSVISSLEINGFQMPLNMQNKIRNNLLQVQQIIQILCSAQPENSKPLTNNAICLINALVEILATINTTPPTLSYSSLILKLNNIILATLSDITKYFENKLFNL